MEASKDRSPVHAYVADHGQGVSQTEIEHATIAGREVSLSNDVTTEERTLIEDAILATEPTDKACFANSLRLWDYDSRFAYVEGFAIRTDLDLGGIEHAWCLLDGETLVDPTTAFDHYHGVRIEDPDTLQRYVETVPGEGIIGNRRNQWEFLRERGYVDRSGTLD